MTTLSSANNSLFLNIGGGGSGGDVNIELELHEGTVATETVLGHVKIDNKTIKMNSDQQIYVDFGTGELRKKEFILKPDVVGQSEFEFVMEDYDQLKYVDLLFYNTTKVHAMNYDIQVVDASTFTYKVVLVNPAPSLNAVYNLVLIWNDSKSIQSRLTKLEYVMQVSPNDSSVIDIPFNTYDPETYIDLLFNNTTKVHGTDYQILPVDVNDLSKGYYIKLNNPPNNPANMYYNLVFITNGLVAGGGYVDVSRFYNGSNTPIDTSMIWYKTS